MSVGNEHDYAAPTSRDAWIESASRYVTDAEECDCDCFLCIRGEHCDGCYCEGMGLTNEQFREAVDTLYEDLLKDRIVTVLTEHAEAFRSAGFRVSGPHDLSDDSYRWYLTVESDDLPEPVDVSLGIAESPEYEGTTDGINFDYSIVAYGGHILGGLQPMNYTPEVWVDVRDVEAVEDRLRIIEECDVSQSIALVSNYRRSSA